MKKIFFAAIFFFSVSLRSPLNLPGPKILGLFSFQIVQTLSNLAKASGCYKVCLDCKESNVGFYEKAGFQRRELQMAQYFE